MVKYKVSDKADRVRADIFVASKYPEFTRSSLEDLFEKEMVRIGDRPAKAGQKLKAGEVVSIDDKLLRQKPIAVNLPIIYQDENVIVINKPEGVLTHSKGALNQESTVASFIANKLNDPSLTGNRAGIVHRLDRGTSGVIITARNSVALKHLQKQFSQRRTKKTYLALVEGAPDPSSAIIDAPIARNPKRPQTFVVNSQGKPARTTYEVKAKEGDISLVELRPETGRTHQLRVHMKYVGNPIVGDLVYGEPDDHLFLHAKSLEITLPGGHRQLFEVPLPKYFQDRLDA